MKKWWMKGLAVALCAGMLAPAAAVSMPGMGMTVYATNSGAGTSGTEDSKKNENTTAPTEDKITSASLLKAVNSLKAQKISLQPNEEQAKKLDEKLNEAYGMLGYKDGTCNVSECKYSSQEEVDAYVNVVKSQMNDIVNPPKDDRWHLGNSGSQCRAGSQHCSSCCQYGQDQCDQCRGYTGIKHRYSNLAI